MRLSKLWIASLLMAAVLAVMIGGRRKKMSAGILLVSAGIPIACLIAWNLRFFGDLTGSAMKIQILGWTLKPFANWWTHPIFTAKGLGYFYSSLIPSFWEGEFVWSLKPLAAPGMGAFYWVSTLLLLGVAVVSLFPRLGAINKSQRQALMFAACCFLASIGYLAVLSMAFDFRGCMYPSRKLPYFTSGRLMLGSLIPFLLLYVYGLHCIIKKLKIERAQWWVLGGIALLILASSVAVDSVAFFSHYNWFHMLGRM